MTDEADRLLLLQIAREAIVARVTGASAPPASSDAAVLSSLGGAFVTIHHRGELRGCIGHVEANQPLGQVIPYCASAACGDDRRFAPVTAAELPDLQIELSLLGPLELVSEPRQVEIGRHGLVVEDGSRRGLLLPHVATEWKWDAETFLAQTCHKAGMARDAWLHGAKVFRFEAEIFSD